MLFFVFGFLVLLSEPTPFIIFPVADIDCLGRNFFIISNPFTIIFFDVIYMGCHYLAESVLDTSTVFAYSHLAPIVTAQIMRVRFIFLIIRFFVFSRVFSELFVAFTVEETRVVDHVFVDCFYGHKPLLSLIKLFSVLF